MERDEMLYFSYGSNMSQRRLQARVTSATFVTVATLAGHSLRFHKVGRDGSAKCDALHTGDPADQVIGVVFRIDPAEKYRLDRAEGLGKGYEHKQVSIVTTGQASLDAFSYYATDIRAGLQPFCWYREHVLRGCSENRLPAHYIGLIEAKSFVSDPDSDRRIRELAIYG